MRYKNAILILFLLSFHSFSLFSQDIESPKVTHFGQRFIFGNSITYIPLGSDFEPTLWYHEFAWNLDLAINLDKHFYVGVSYKDIRTKGSTVIQNSGYKDHYFMTGIFSQYNFDPSDKNRVYLQLGGNYSNYCTCGKDDPYKVEGLYYGSLGSGFDLPLKEWLSFDFAFLVYVPFSKLNDAHYFTQYEIGLNVDLVLRK